MARSRVTTNDREGLRRDFDPVARPEKVKGKGKGNQRPIFQQAVECWNCDMATDPLNADRRQGRQYYGQSWDYTKIGGFKAGREGRSDGRIMDGPGSNIEADGAILGHQAPAAVPQPGASTTGAADPTPSGGSVPEPRVPPRPRIVSEEYTEVNGQPHTKRPYADGTVEFESW